jgi:hypothetical protein
MAFAQRELRGRSPRAAKQLVQFLSLTTDMAKLKSSLGRVTVQRPRQPFDHLAVDALELLRRENVSYVLANVTGGQWHCGRPGA